MIFERNGIQIRYWLAGPTHAPLVVFTHGVIMDHRMFAAQVEAVAQKYRVLTWDVRGHGQSELGREDFSIEVSVEDLAALLDRLGYERAALVGHSMGGLVSQEFLFRYPERVFALATVGSPCLTLKPSFIIEVGMRLSPRAIRHYPYALFKWQVSRGITITPTVRAYVYEVLDRVSKQQFVAMWSVVVNCIHAEPDYRISHPLLIAHGEQDNLGLGFIKQHNRAWAARDPNCNYVVVPEGGHNAHQENPAFFNPVLLEFLRKYVPVE